MKKISSSTMHSAVERSRLLDVGELVEISGLTEVDPVIKSRPYLLAEEEEASLPPEGLAPDPTMLILNQILGPNCTVDNPAWMGDPVPRMRSLQKKIVEHALTLPDVERSSCMEGIRVVEMAVQWRLRWLQMRRSEAESNFISTEENIHEEKKIA